VKTRCERKRAERARRCLRRREPLASPVGVIELGQDRDLVQRQPGACSERQAEPELVAILAFEDRTSPREERQSDSGYEVVYAELLLPRSGVRKGADLQDRLMLCMHSV